MPPHSLRYLSSKPFEIKSKDKSYFIHSGILDAQSDLTDADWDGELDLSNWESDTAELFAEFLYTGDYHTLGSTLGGEETEGEEEEQEGVGQHRANTPDTVQSLAAREEGESHEADVSLLVHAQLFVLAQDMGIEALKTITLKRLKAALKRVERHISNPEVLESVVDLLLYVYGRMDFYTACDEPVRELILEFAASNLRELVHQRGMRTLLAEPHDFAIELVDKLASRISCMEMLVQELGAEKEEKVQQLEAANMRMLQLEGKLRNLGEIRKYRRQCREAV